MSVKISELPIIASNDILSSSFPASDIVNDTTYKVPIQSVYSSFFPHKKTSNSKTSSHTLSPSDCNSNVLFNNQDPDTTALLTVPRHKRGRIPIGSTINIVRNNIGDVLITPSSGVEIYPSCDMYLRDRYSTASLTKIDLNKWILSGDLSESGNSSSYDRYINQVVLLLHLDQNLIDESLSPKTCSLVNINDGALYDTQAAKFGSHGIRFDGTKYIGEFNAGTLEYSRLVINSPSGITSNWTFEMWFKPSTQWNSSSSRQDLLTGGGRFSEWVDLYYENSNIKFSIYSGDEQITSENYPTPVSRYYGDISASWHHIAMSRSGSTVRLFLDGIQLGANIVLGGANSSDNVSSISDFRIGGRFNYDTGDNGMVGVWGGTSLDVDEIRITEAYRYSSNFSLPETPFQDP